MSIYETENFVLEAHSKPEIDRLEGGHVTISPKEELVDRTELSPMLAIELMRFTIVAGKAMVAGMKTRGVDIGRINYQENGNWKPQLHIHLYCRAKTATMQKYGEPITPGHKPEFHPLNEDDIAAVRREVERLFATLDFSNEEWGL